MAFNDVASNICQALPRGSPPGSAPSYRSRTPPGAPAPPGPACPPPRCPGAGAYARSDFSSTRDLLSTIQPNLSHECVLESLKLSSNVSECKPLPGCGSAWKNPKRSTCCRYASTASRAWL